MLAQKILKLPIPSLEAPLDPALPSFSVDNRGGWSAPSAKEVRSTSMIGARLTIWNALLPFLLSPCALRAQERSQEYERSNLKRVSYPTQAEQ